MNRTVQEFNKRMHDEWFEQRFIALRPRNGTMIFLGWDEAKQLYDFVDYHGHSRSCSKDFLLGYIEGMTMIVSNEET